MSAEDQTVEHQQGRSFQFMPLNKELLTVDGFLERETQFSLGGMAPGRLTKHQWITAHPGVRGKHTLDSMDFKKICHKVRELSR